MAVFKKVEVIQASPVLIPTLANHLKEVFEKEMEKKDFVSEKKKEFDLKEDAALLE